jgi:hypothetical protein
VYEPPGPVQGHGSSTKDSPRGLSVGAPLLAEISARIPQPLVLSVLSEALYQEELRAFAGGPFVRGGHGFSQLRLDVLRGLSPRPLAAEPDRRRGFPSPAIQQ